MISPCRNRDHAFGPATIAQIRIVRGSFRAVWRRLMAMVGLSFLAATLAGGVQAAETADARLAPTKATVSALVLTNAEQVHRLPRERAATRLPVLIRGVVTCALPGFRAAVVQDGDAGIYIDHWPSSIGAPKVGEWVQVEGITDPGEFAPRVDASKIQLLG
ncbi:MAG: hypothetical protein ACRED1_02870, partial [Limisphaerales bacterium]